MGRHDPTIFHLMFEDDLLLFGEAMEKQMKRVMKNLQIFSSMSGQEVSKEKTSVFFSKNVNRNTRDNLVHLLSFYEKTPFRKYIGVPFSGKGLK